MAENPIVSGIESLPGDSSRAAKHHSISKSDPTIAAKEAKAEGVTHSPRAAAWRGVRDMFLTGGIGIAAAFGKAAGADPGVDPAELLGLNALFAQANLSSVPQASPKKKYRGMNSDDFNQNNSKNTLNEPAPTIGERNLTVSLDGESFSVRIKVQYGEDGLPIQWSAEHRVGDRDKVDPKSPLGQAIDAKVSQWSFLKSTPRT